MLLSPGETWTQTQAEFRAQLKAEASGVCARHGMPGVAGAPGSHRSREGGKEQGTVPARASAAATRMSNFRRPELCGCASPVPAPQCGALCSGSPEKTLSVPVHGASPAILWKRGENHLLAGAGGICCFRRGWHLMAYRHIWSTGPTSSDPSPPHAPPCSAVQNARHRCTHPPTPRSFEPCYWKQQSLTTQPQK